MSRIVLARVPGGKWLAVALAVAALVFPRGATADESKRRETFRQGVAAMSAEKWDEAFALYRQLWDEERTYDVALSLGQAELNLKKYRDAAEHLQFGLLNIPPREDAEVSARARRMLDVARQEVATVEVQVDRTGADVLADERVVGKSPLPGAVFLDPGSHTIEARLAEARTAQRSIVATPGMSTAINLSFAESANSAAAASAAAMTAPPAPAATDNASSTDGSDDSTARTVVLISGISVTTIAAALTITFALQGSSASSDAEDARARATARYGSDPCSTPAGAGSSECSDLASALDRRSSANKVANTSLLIGAVAAVATVTTFFVWPSKRAASEHALRLVPAVGPTSGGAFVTGSF